MALGVFAAVARVLWLCCGCGVAVRCALNSASQPIRRRRILQPLRPNPLRHHLVRPLPSVAGFAAGWTRSSSGPIWWTVPNPRAPTQECSQPGRWVRHSPAEPAAFFSLSRLLLVLIGAARFIFVCSHAAAPAAAARCSCSADVRVAVGIPFFSSTWHVVVVRQWEGICALRPPKRFHDVMFCGCPAAVISRPLPGLPSSRDTHAIVVVKALLRGGPR